MSDKRKGGAAKALIGTIGPPDALVNDGSPSRWVSLLLGLMMIMVPAMGVPSEEMLQDTLKSALVSLMSICTGLVFFWLHHGRREPIVWHGLLWLPLALATYSIGSMAWSHAYLGGVEAVRWLVFSLLMWLGMNIRLADFEGRVLWGIHWGISVASVWTALQFWIDFNVFPQGPNPASTFVNRNFFAEYAICALPYSVYLMVRSRSNWQTMGLAASIGFNLAALMMTGTRSALIALVVLLVVLPLIFIRCWQQVEASRWTKKKIVAVVAVLLGTVMSLGSINTNNPKLIDEFGPLNAISRAVGRTVSLASPDEYTKGSFSIRSVMWAATGRMIAANPITGVGAGAWEVHAPLYQLAGTQLETDFYAHNEILQLLAEYGVVGWVFLGLLFAYLSYAAFKTWSSDSQKFLRQAPLRAIALASLVTLLIVSNAGFPWRMASTGALFALSLSLLAGSDAQLDLRGRLLASFWVCKGACVRSVMSIGAVCMMLALYITQRAEESERTLIRGIKLALTISRSGNPNHRYWDTTKQEMLDLMRKGIALNRHYRKLTPMAADELASWGDWKNALWIWESVLESRPNVVAIIANIARANLEMGNVRQTQAYLERAKRLQPTAPAVRTLEVILLARTGQEQLAGQKVKALFQDNVVDYDLIYAAYLIGARTQDWPLMIQALELRIQHWPTDAVDGWLKLGNIYDQKPEIRDQGKALSAYRAALAASSAAFRDTTLSKIPPTYRDQL